MCDEDEISETSQSLEISPPRRHEAEHPSEPWTLRAYSKKVIKGWEEVCEDIPENATRCYEWLSAHPKERITGRCFELKYKQYMGIWCFEVGSGHRIYYKPRDDRRDVLIYFAGRHPKKIPYPPKDL